MSKWRSLAIEGVFIALGMTTGSMLYDNFFNGEAFDLSRILQQLLMFFVIYVVIFGGMAMWKDRNDA